MWIKRIVCYQTSPITGWWGCWDELALDRLGQKWKQGYNLHCGTGELLCSWWWGDLNWSLVISMSRNRDMVKIQVECLIFHFRTEVSQWSFCGQRIIFSTRSTAMLEAFLSAHSFWNEKTVQSKVQKWRTLPYLYLFVLSGRKGINMRHPMYDFLCLHRQHDNNTCCIPPWLWICLPFHVKGLCTCVKTHRA